jgi:hypothetical protein
LGDFVLLLFTERGVKRERSLSLEPTGSVVVRVPIAPGEAYAAAYFLDERLAGEILPALSHGTWR